MTHYFFGLQLLASSPTPARWADEWSPWDNCSIAYFCPGCGEVWGRMLREGKSWHTVTSPCRAHGSTWRVGGLFHHPWQRILDDFPTEVLTHDFLSLFTHWQRSQQ